MPYGCNDNIKGVGNLSSPGCNEINVMSLFEKRIYASFVKSKIPKIFEVVYR
jgi:hypothetical protein